MASPIAGLLRQTGEQILGYGIGQAISTPIAVFTQPILNDLWSASPTLPLDPQVAAQVAIKNPGLIAAMTAEAAKTGISGGNFAHIIDAVNVPPGIGELLELYRRKEISADELERGFRSAQIEDEWLAHLPVLARVLMSPADLAMARQQGFVSEDDARTRAALQGVNADDANLMYELAGLPPGAGEALELLRRGHIDETRFAQMIREGHTKTKYTDDLLNLRFQPLPTSFAVEALVRERITPEEAQSLGEQNGISGADILKWADMLGRPIATGEALTLVRRGEMNATQFREVIARSDVRTEYTDDILKLRRVIPPLFQIERLVQGGALSDEQALKYVIEEGYDSELAHGIVDAAHKTKTAHVRHLASSQISELYQSGIENKQWALDALVNLGYDQQEAEWYLEIIDAQRLLAALKAHLNRIHTLYVSHKITADDASMDLDSLGIAHGVRDDLLDEWAHERAQNVAVLTNAQIGRALKLNIISDVDAIAKWMQNGYSQNDADILAAIVGHPQSGANPVPA